MRRHYIILFILLSATLFSGCKKDLRPTSIEVKDPVRHYYAIKQGEDLPISVQISNTGQYPLVINEVQTSCGCIVLDDESQIIVPVDGKTYVRFKYNTTKNVGLVSHTVWFYGNILPKGVTTMKFDVNVVPSADYGRDYETLFEQYSEKNGKLKEAVDGTSAERSYYTREP